MCIICDEAEEIEIDYWEDVFKDESWASNLESLVPLFYSLAIANVSLNLTLAAKNLNSTITK
jgi:hypothetical protein